MDWINVVAQLIQIGATTLNNVRSIAKSEGLDDEQLEKLDRLYADRIAKREKESR